MEARYRDGMASGGGVYSARGECINCWWRNTFDWRFWTTTEVDTYKHVMDDFGNLVAVR